MPVLEVDQTGLICIATLAVFTILLLVWLVFHLCAASNAMHEKARDLEMQQTTEKAPVVTSFPLDEEPGSWLDSPFRPDQGDKRLPNPAFVSVSTHEIEYAAFKVLLKAGHGTN